MMMTVPALPDVPLPVPLVAELPPPAPGMPGPVPPLSTPVEEPGGLSPALQLTLAAAGSTSPSVAKTQVKKLGRFGVMELSLPDVTEDATCHARARLPDHRGLASYRKIVESRTHDQGATE
jgi:hypothetical protein